MPNFALNNPKKVVKSIFKFLFWLNLSFKIDKTYMKKLYGLGLQHIKIWAKSSEAFSRKKIKTPFFRLFKNVIFGF